MSDVLDREKVAKYTRQFQAESRGLSEMPYLTLGEILKRKIKWDWLIEKLLKSGCVYQLHGQWKAGKSLVALDMGLHVAQGKDWCGRRSMMALVVYVAGEAVEDIEGRIQAFADSNDLATDAPFYLRSKPVYLTSEAYAQGLADEIEVLQQEWPELPILIFVDTLARNFGPGKSESSDSDMGAFINNVIDLVSRPHKATTVVVHHPGHSSKERGRGHSSLPGAVDGTLMVDQREGIVVLSTKEMRNLASDEAALAWAIKGVELEAEDNFGNKISAPVLVAQEYAPALNAGDSGLGKNQSTGLDVLRELYAKAKANKANGAIARVPWTNWREGMEGAGIPRNKTYEVRKSLQIRGITDEYGEAIMPADENP